MTSFSWPTKSLAEFPVRHIIESEVLCFRRDFAVGHDASASLIGYIYQLRYALKVLLNSDDPERVLVLEKYDDIAIFDGPQPAQLIQLKHHKGTSGSLADRSTDLWRTIASWIDSVAGNQSLLVHAVFSIVTTAQASEGSIAAMLRQPVTCGEVDIVYSKLHAIALEGRNAEHANFYKKFMDADPSVVKSIIKNTQVFDKQPDIVDCEREIRQILRFCCAPQFVDDVFSQLEGYWFRECISALCTQGYTLPNQGRVLSEIRKIAGGFAEDNLPTDLDDLQVEELVLSDDGSKLFQRQLNAIGVGARRIDLAKKDYYKASVHRSRWLQHGSLLLPDELDRYDSRLVDEWDHRFAAMEDELGQEADEDDKRKAGRALLGELENLNCPIREKCTHAFVMRGSFHILANIPRIGWHIDFETLCSEGEGGEFDQ